MDILDSIPAKDFLKLTMKDNAKNLDVTQDSVLDIINRYMDGEIITDILKDKGWNMRQFLFNVAQFPSIATTLTEVRAIHNESFKQNLMSIINKDAKKEWRAASWLLERMFPKEFGKNIKHTHENGEYDDPECLSSYTNVDYEEIE